MKNTTTNKIKELENTIIDIKKEIKDLKEQKLRREKLKLEDMTPEEYKKEQDLILMEEVLDEIIQRKIEELKKLLENNPKDAAELKEQIKNLKNFLELPFEDKKIKELQKEMEEIRKSIDELLKELYKKPTTLKLR